MTLSQKDTRRVVRGLEKQGAKIKKTKDGHRVLFPDGTTEMVHWSTSDHRATANMRSAVRRAGFHWPLDGEGKGTVMAKAGTGIDPRKIITQNKIRRVLSNLPTEGFTTSDAVKLSGVSFTGMANNLPELGYNQTFHPETKQKLWLKVQKKSTKSQPVEEPVVTIDTEHYPEIDAAKARESAQAVTFEIPEPQPEKPVVVEVEVEVEEPTIEPERLDGWENLIVTVGDGAGPEVAGEHKLAELAQIPAFVEAVVAVAPPVLIPAPVTIGSARTSGGREFIDSEDSWTLEGLLPEDVLRMAKMMGLEIELRVWRSPQSQD